MKDTDLKDQLDGALSELEGIVVEAGNDAKDYLTKEAQGVFQRLYNVWLGLIDSVDDELVELEVDEWLGPKSTEMLGRAFAHLGLPKSQIDVHNMQHLINMVEADQTE